MTNITTIPLAELKTDLAAAIMDAKTCRRMLATGYDKRLVERLEGEEQIIDVIREEIERRGE